MNSVLSYPQHSLFEGLNNSELQQASRYLRAREFSVGSIIFNSRQAASCLYLLESGLVRLGFNSPNGDYQLLDICEDGDIFGEMFLGNYKFRIGQAEAITAVQVYVLDEDSLYQLIYEFPQIATNFIRHLSDSKRRVLARVHALQRTDAKAKLLTTLLSLARTKCCSDGDYFVLNQTISQQDIADMTGLNRSTVSSLINRFRQEGVLGGTGRYLILEVEQIEQILQSDGLELLE